MSKYILGLAIVGVLCSIMSCAGSDASSSVGDSRSMSSSEQSALQGLDGNPGANMGGGR